MNLSPHHLREQYRLGLLKPSQVMQHVLERRDAEDQSGVWISTVDPQQALQEALGMDARIGEIDDLPLYGLIFSVKDCIDVQGVPTTSACPESAYTPTHASPVVDRAIAAGALYFGKTNLDQFCTGLVGVRSPYGVARNPHNPLYIPGGSSSGAAVSVATDTSSFALGTDTGGSGRVPASYCGVTGLKPAPGCLSRRGMVSACRTIDTISVYTQQPRDGYVVLEVLAGYDAHDPFSDASYRVDAWAPSDTDLSGIRLAVPDDKDLNFFGNQETAGLFDQAVRQASRLFGAPDRFSYALFAEINALMFMGPLVAERDVSFGQVFDAHPEAGVDAVRQLVIGSRSQTAADAYRAHYRIMEVRRELEGFWGKHDVMLLPTVGTQYTVDQALEDPFSPSFNNGYYTNFANPLGLSAISVPFARTAANVPYGVTFVAPAGGERFLSQLGQHFMNAERD